jgi:hypothetical protein
VLHSDLQGLDYYVGDMDTLTPQTKEDIEFQIGLVVTLNTGKTLLEFGKLSRIALFGPLKQIFADLHNFCRFAHMQKNLCGSNYLLKARFGSTPMNSKNFLTESIGPH